MRTSCDRISTFGRPAKFILTVLAVLLGQARPVHGQGASADWEAPFKISEIPGSTGSAAVTGDSRGNVYVIWAGNSGTQPGANRSADTLYFRRWDGAHWSASTDVIAVPQGGPSLALDAFAMDTYGRLALLWHANRELVLSTADPADAHRASAWLSRTVMQGEIVWGADLESGPDGRLHVLVAGERQNVYYFQSADAGRSWDLLARLSYGEDASLQVGYPRLALGGDGGLHATWTEHVEANNWTASVVVYARSWDGGQTWSEGIRLVDAVGHGQSNLAADAKSNVFVFWDRSVGSVDGRYYAFSKNSGEAWQGPFVAYEGISGFSGTPDLLWDSRGQLHLLSGGYGAVGSQIWESTWEGDRWALPTPVSVRGTLTGSEVFDSTVVGGNRMLLIWVDYDTREVWFTSKTLDAPLAADTFLPTPTPPPASTPTPKPLPAPPATPLPVAAAALLESDSPITAPSLPLLAALAPVLALIGLVALFRRGGR